MAKWDFIVVKEDWSRYLVSDGTQLKIKVAVVDLLRSVDLSPTGYPNVGIASQNLVSAIVPDRLKRLPSKEPWNPKTDVGEEMKFEVMEEKWQEYHTPDAFKVLVKPVLMKVFRYDKYNNFGEPIYSVNVQPLTNVEKVGPSEPTIQP